MLARVYVIQRKSSGEFLTPGLFFSKSLKRAGRLNDYMEALDTADANLSDGDFEIHSFYEGTPDDAMPN